MLPLNDQPIPIRIDEHGVARIGGTRIPLETIVGAFRRGASPEEIVQSAFRAQPLPLVTTGVRTALPELSGDHPPPSALYS